MKRSTALLFVLVVALVIAACASAAPVVTPTPTATEVVPTPTITPTETLTQTSTPENTPTPEVERFDFSSSVNPDKIPNMEKWFLGQPYALADMSDQAGFSSIDVTGSVVSYKLVNEGFGPSMYANFVFKNGVVRAKVDYIVFYLPTSPFFIGFETNKLTPEEASQVSDRINNSFDQINSTENDRIHPNAYLLLSAINSQSEAEKCGQKYLIPNIKKDVCAYKGTLDAVSSQGLIDEFNNALVPIPSDHLEDFYQPESVSPLLSSRGQRIVVRLQVNPGPY